jgi:hypothetical protein
MAFAPLFFLRWVAVDPIECLNIGRVRIVTRLAPFIGSLIAGQRFADERYSDEGGGAADSAYAYAAQEVTTSYSLYVIRLGLHRVSSSITGAPVNQRTQKLQFDLQNQTPDHSEALQQLSHAGSTSPPVTLRSP